MAGRIERGQVRLVAFRQPDKLRPVVVLTNPGAIPSLSKLTVAAITSTMRGVPSNAILDEDDGMNPHFQFDLDIPAFQRPSALLLIGVKPN
jgi:mRNA-degrading endonuclease toxin of MazEF toxin-antitoxin module